MGVYIKGMKMPKGCDDCILGDVVCGYDEDHIDRDCPLVEVPEPHGRLIDANAFHNNMDYVCSAGGWLEPVTKAVNEYVHKHIDAQTTVIEAEGE